MSIIMAVCLLFGLLLAKMFKCFVLVPASLLVMAADLFIQHGGARGFPAAGLEILVVIASLQTGYLAGALSPLFLSARKGRQMRASAIFTAAPFARAPRRDGRMPGSTRDGAAPEAPEARRKDVITPAA
jgi:hypothetical protein